MGWNFDEAVDRAGTHSVKHDARESVFGRADVTPLWIADMEFAAPPCVQQAIAERARHPLYGYTLVPESLVHAVIDWHAARYAWTVDPDSLLFSPGTLPALSLIIAALTAPDDGVVIQPPVYSHFTDVVQNADRPLMTNPLLEQDGKYRMDLDHLEQCFADGGQLLVLCNPHNPVGRVWDRDELEAVLALARRHDVTVVSDDIHCDLTYADAGFVPLGRLARADDRVISVLSPGKTFNTQGLALAAVVVPRSDLHEAISDTLTARQLFNFNPFSLVAAEAAWRDGNPWREALLAYLQTTRDAVVAFVRQQLTPIRVTPPQAGYLMWLDCRELGLDDTQLADFFIRECGLGLNPGTEFGTGGSGFMRLNIGAPRAHIMTALERLRAGLAAR